MASEVAALPFRSYSAESVYNTIPQYIQDADAAVGYPFYLYLYGICKFIDTNVNAVARDGIGVAGVFDQNYAKAPGWSQIVDINRCPDFALPWLGQLVGVTVDPSLSKSQKVDKINNRAGFQRGTVAILKSALAALINARLPQGSTPLATSRIIVMEQTGYVGGQYVANNYALVILIPALYISSYTYASLQAYIEVWQSTHTYSANDTVSYNGTSYQALSTNTNVVPAGHPATWTALGSPQIPSYAEANSIVSNYSALASATTPTTTSAYSSLIQQFRPAGVQVFIGGY